MFRAVKGMRGRVGLVAAVALVALLALGVAPAFGIDRYASSSGIGAAPCEQGNPCSLVDAVENVAVAGDTVIVLSDGDYTLGAELQVSDAITVRGEVGEARPKIIRAGNTVSVSNAGATLRRLEFECTSGSQNLQADGAATLEQLKIVAKAPCDVAAQLRNGTLLRDSVAWTDDASGDPAIQTQGTGATITNVTAIGAGTNNDAVVADAALGTTQTVNLRNVIARGTGSGVGIRAVDAGGTGDDDVDVNISFTNHSGIVEDEPDADVIEGAGNTTTAPLFADASSLDFSQLAGSVTRNAGSPNGTIGSVDFDGEDRTQEGTIDIGADEFADVTPPQTTIDSGPAGPTTDTTPTFGFSASEAGSTFECRVDGGGFSVCSSLLNTPPLADGAHTVAVRATDDQGNTDASPATRSFTVDTSAPDVDLGGKKKQKATKKLKVKVTVDEDGSAEATGKVTLERRGKGSAAVKKSQLTLMPASKGVSADQAATLKPKLKKKGLTAIKRALKKGKKAKAKITVEVTDAVGLSTTQKRTIKLK